MPLYDYRCAGCGAVSSELRSIANRHDPLKCTVCKGQMKLDIAPVVGIVKNPAVPRTQKARK